eukprot:scaffold6148_cov282-Prasinococcus_capsulatus_cf.AAC.1
MRTASPTLSGEGPLKPVFRPDRPDYWPISVAIRPFWTAFARPRGSHRPVRPAAPALPSTGRASRNRPHPALLAPSGARGRPERVTGAAKGPRRDQ